MVLVGLAQFGFDFQLAGEVLLQLFARGKVLEGNNGSQALTLFRSQLLRAQTDPGNAARRIAKAELAGFAIALEGRGQPASKSLLIFRPDIAHPAVAQSLLRRKSGKGFAS